MNDLRFALRQLAKNPGFAAVAVLMLALGIGANTVVFSVARAVLFRPLGFVEADRLMWLTLINPQTGVTEQQMSWREMQDVRESTKSFEGIGTFGVAGAIWERGGTAGPVPSLSVTPNLADILRVKPVIGRMIQAEDVGDSAQPVVLIGHELWQTHFGGRPDVLGQTVRLDGKSRTIVGVLPAGLEFPLERAPTLGTGTILTPEIRSFWMPMSVPGFEDRTSRGARMFLPVARLKPDATEESARAELNALGGRLAAEFPDTNRGWTFDVLGFRDQILGATRQGIPLLAVAVAAVLLICCVNLANLLLARGVMRRRELAVRVALGAGRARVIRALLMESVVLAVLGAALGLLVAQGSLKGIQRLAAANVPFIGEATLDGAALVFTLGLSLVTALVFGLVPALRQSHIQPVESLRGGRMSGTLETRAWQRGLLVAQIAIVLVLLTSSVLLLASFRRLVGQDLGYQPKSVVTMDIESWGFETNGELCRTYRRIRERLAALPGIEAVGTVSSAPLTGKWTFDEKPQVFGQSVPDADRPSVSATFVAFDYFEAMGIPLLEGRVFRDSELKDDGYGQIVVVNESAAKVLFPGRSAVGGRFTVGSNPDRVLEVIGVVKDTRDVRLEQKPRPRFYWQYAFGGAQVVVRSSTPARAIMATLRDVTREADSRLIVKDVREMTDIVSGTVAERRFLMGLLTAYTLMALGVAIVGIFGVVAYQVAQRTSEFGLRLALGASPSRLLAQVLAEVGRMTALGLAGGFVMVLGTNRLIASQLYELSPYDPVTLLLAVVLLLVSSLVAGIVPAFKVTRIAPSEALRHE